MTSSIRTPDTSSTGPGASARPRRFEPVTAIAASVPNAAVDPVRRRVQSWLPAGPVKDALSGTWLGHALHPMLTDVPIGCWTSALVLDVVGGRAARPAAQKLIALGCLAALPTAATGAADWSDTSEEPARIGAVHAASNTVALLCYSASWSARRKDHHARGVVLGLLGAGAATVGGYLGGHLLASLGIGVDQTAFSTGSDDWAPVASDAIVHADELVRARAGETAVMLLRDGGEGGEGGELVCLGARCPHRGAPMEQGEHHDGVVTCPWHGSRFSLHDGALLRGPATAPLPRFECRVTEGVVEVRRRRGANEPDGRSEHAG